VEAAGIEDTQGWCDNSLRDATLPRTSLRFFENSIPSPSSSSRAVPAGTAASWQPDGNAPLSAPRLSEPFQPIAWTATRMKHRNQEQRIVVHGVDQFDREGPEHHQRSP